MNRYYYGKSGQGDFTPEKLPRTRGALFREMLKLHPGDLLKLNLLYAVIWLPAALVLLVSVSSWLYTDAAEAPALSSFLMSLSLMLAPCVAITGPLTAGAAYITRCWASDRHVFLWADFKGTAKSNLKQALIISALTGLLLPAGLFSFFFYGDLAASMPVMVIPQVLVAAVGLLWSLMLLYIYPLMVSYRLRLRDLLKNALLLAVGCLPWSLGLRLGHSLPAMVCLLLVRVTGSLWPLLLLAVWELVFGLALSRFTTASVTNAAFDRYLNPYIEGAVTRRGMAPEEKQEKPRKR